MGDYNTTCFLSNYAITKGTKVKLFRLTKNSRSTRNHATSEWFPNTLPVDAVYGGSGEVEVNGEEIVLVDGHNSAYMLVSEGAWNAFMKLTYQDGFTGETVSIEKVKCSIGEFVGSAMNGAVTDIVDYNLFAQHVTYYFDTIGHTPRRELQELARQKDEKKLTEWCTRAAEFVFFESLLTRIRKHYTPMSYDGSQTNFHTLTSAFHTAMTFVQDND